MDRDELARLGSLAKLKLERESAETMLLDIEAMLEYVSCLDELDSGEAPATARSRPAGREDTPAPGVAPGEATGGCAEVRDGHFKVPKVI